ncbi:MULTISPECIES: hypothetical protein [Vibrio]|nr:MULTISPECIES: hypothetical protein [Vibrio]
MAYTWIRYIVSDNVTQAVLLLGVANDLNQVNNPTPFIYPAVLFHVK